ncbi:MAG: hypothetical protein J0I06_23165 [Planctomycetes bacterium]|nr:hypothetical protein [Planctomycetota bacterium]
MDDVVARCPDCGREHAEEFARCDWCGRNAPSRWWCAACTDWRAARACPACAGGVAVPSELNLGPCVVGARVTFQFSARNAGKKPRTCLVESAAGDVALVNSRFVLPAGGTATVSGEIVVPEKPLGRRNFRLVTFDGTALSETWVVLEAVSAAPRLEFLPPLVQLRAAHPGTVVRSSVALKNTGNVPLAAALSASSAWLAVEPKRLALAPGEFAEVKLRVKSKKTDSGRLEAKLTAAAADGVWEATVRCLLPEPELAADPVDFGELKPGRAAFADVVVRNVGRVRVNGSVEADAPWLRVTPTRINLPPGGEKRVRVRAVLSVEEDGPLTSELLVSSPAGVVLRVPVSATGKVPRPVLRAVRRQRLRDAIGPPVERKFQVANDGDGRLDLTATADAPWIQIVTPELHVAPGKKRKLRYVVDLESLPLGEHAAAIAIESNGGAATVPVTVEVLDPNPVLEIVSGPDLGLTSPDQPLSAAVQVRNSGIGLLKVRAESENPRNTLSPAEADVPPGPPVRFNLTIPVSGLTGGAYEAGVRLTSNGGAGRAAVRFRLTPEQLDVPALLDLGPREAGRVRWDWLWVRNTGQYPVTLRVRAEDAVRLELDRVTVASLQTVPVPFYLNLPDEARGPVTGAILLEGRALRHRVAVRAVARKVELVLEQKTLDLGKLRPGEERAFTVDVVNVGEIPAEIYDAQAPGELEVRVRKATVLPGARVALVGTARANTDGTGAEVGAVVRLNHGLKLRCEATVVPPLWPRVFAVTAAAGGLIAGAGVSVAVGWGAGVPLALVGVLAGAWLFWRETT